MSQPENRHTDIDESTPAYLRAVRSLGERVKAARTHLQITQKELATRLGLSQGYISAVENGKDKPNIDLATGLLTLFPELSPDWIMTGRGRMLRDASDRDGSDDYNMDIEALRVSLQIFYSELSKTEGSAATRLVASEPYYVNLMYRTYMSYLRSLTGQGVSDVEARAAARAECELLDRRKMG